MAEGEPLPWEEWALEFRTNLPKPIRKMMEELLGRDSEGDHAENIKARLKKIEELIRFTRYRRTADGSTNTRPGRPLAELPVKAIPIRRPLRSRAVLAAPPRICTERSLMKTATRPRS
ncbi:MAG: hypothetical protein J0H98_03250 [Solirubrobacterales bacterium]|nr:hypothetical protein [Solirubrobacterales bacterium]